MTTATSRNGGGRNSLSGQAVVPIGGAPFVPPLRTMMQHEAMYVDGSPSRRTSGASDVATDSSGVSSVSSSPTTESVVEEEERGTSPSSPVSPTWQAAAIRYSSAMQQHTRQMWENERLNIERARLGLLTTSNSTTTTTTTNEANRTTRSHHGGGGGNSVMAAAAREDGLQKRNTISGSVDAFFRGRKRHNKTASIV